MVLCLMWCLRREINDLSFEDYGWTVMELKDFFFFKILYHWTTVFYLNIFSFHVLEPCRVGLHVIPS
jgi:hypothetical protein